jgi:hypothetical protein
MDAQTKPLIERAKEVNARSYVVRFRAQSIAGLAFVLRRDAERMRAEHKDHKQRHPHLSF